MNEGKLQNIQIYVVPGSTLSDSSGSLTLARENVENDSPVPCVVHCFTGSVEELKQYLSFGFYIGLTGYIINSLTHDQLSEMLQLITLDRLVIETDAPYMGFKGCRMGDSLCDKKKKNQKYPNVPTALILIAQHIATVSGWSLEEIAEKTTDNALRFFRVERSRFPHIIE
eukprot:gene25600-32072_t